MVVVVEFPAAPQGDFLRESKASAALRLSLWTDNKRTASSITRSGFLCRIVPQQDSKRSTKALVIVV